MFPGYRLCSSSAPSRQYVYEDPFNAVFSRLPVCNFSTLNCHVTQSLWVSKTNGSDCREIGSIPVRSAATLDRKRKIQDLRWAPDGKHITFMYGGSLWSVHLD